MKQDFCKQLKIFPPLVKIQDRLWNLLEAYLHVERLNGVQRCISWPIRTSSLPVDETSLSETSKLARDFFQAGETPILDPIALLESKGLRVISTPMEPSVSSFSIVLKDAGLSIFVNAGDTAERKIFSLAYELGMLTLSSPGMGANSIQNSANHFAGCFLMPEGVMRREFGSLEFSESNSLSFSSLMNLKSRFGVSAEAFLKRAFSLKLISEKNHVLLSKEIHAHYLKTNHEEPWLKGHLPQLSENARLFNLVELAVSRKKMSGTDAKAILEKFGW